MQSITKIMHGIASRTSDLFIDPMHPFYEYIKGKLLKFAEKYAVSCIPYTIGENEDYITIAICHPFDCFNPDVAEQIVFGRINRAMGQLVQKNGSYREPYKESLPYIYRKIKEEVK